ncbi:hypothetical protein IOC61_08055 [Halomonas sp. KAO]|uniref:hypothetical protein n=1 Tax=Halomonas sp. KAO TaxID=2783858 RepID=UPI00189F2F7A|nr:hypothetical protein [Halomonas sp. KAO]MBF7053277.1 hypothetical protein [Halomonas sp. KAO]
MKPALHAGAGAIATLTILTFWMSTAVSELFLSYEAIASVKRAILYGMLVLIPALAMTGGSGFFLARGRQGRILDTKKKRMRLLAANGLLILVPAAFYLDSKAASGEFDQLFYAVQVVELLVGLIQLTLLGLNFRDGLRLMAGQPIAQPPR